MPGNWNKKWYDKSVVCKNKNSLYSHPSDQVFVSNVKIDTMIIIWIDLKCRYIMLNTEHVHRADSRLAPSQRETSLQSNADSHWLGANLESALYTSADQSLHLIITCRQQLWLAPTHCSEGRRRGLWLIILWWMPATLWHFNSTYLQSIFYLLYFFQFNNQHDQFVKPTFHNN